MSFMFVLLHYRMHFLTSYMPVTVVILINNSLCPHLTSAVKILHKKTECEVLLPVHNEVLILNIPV